MGPYGPLLFVVTVICAELIPLFPTQPLSLASGLLFGPRLVRALQGPGLRLRPSMLGSLPLYRGQGILLLCVCNG